MNRRDFLKLISGAFASLYVSGFASEASFEQIPALNRWVPNVPGDYFGFLAIGDMGTGWKSQYELVKKMALLPTAYYPSVVLLGDIFYPSAKAELIQPNFVQPFAPLLQQGRKFYPVLGNHDWIEEKAKYVKSYFAAPDYYTFKLGSCQLWTINSNSFDATQASWLNQSLRSSSASWKIVMLHHSPYSSGMVHHSNSSLIKNLCPILIQNKVDLCLSGHNHLYERTQKIEGVTYVVSGGGSASLHKFEPEVNFARAQIKPVHHFLKINGNSKSLLLEAVDLNSNTFDRLSLVK